jgi:hypothetical protein
VAGAIGVRFVLLVLLFLFCVVACEGGRLEPEGIFGIGQEEAVEIVPSKELYQLGEEVAFTIVNQSKITIFYTYGCARALVFKIEGEESIGLAVDILESIPDVTRLAAADRKECRWNQKVWQDPSREGRARFEHYDELALVPAGRYRLGLIYFSNESDIDSAEGAKTIYSPVFVID